MYVRTHTHVTRPQRMSSRPEELLALESSGEVMVVVLARRRRDTGTFLPPAMMQQNGFWDLQGCVVDIIFWSPSEIIALILVLVLKGSAVSSRPAALRALVNGAPRHGCCCCRFVDHALRNFAKHCHRERERKRERRQRESAVCTMRALALTPLFTPFATRNSNDPTTRIL